MHIENKEGLIIDLGCGNAKETNAIGVDNVALPTVDIVHDLLDFPYPFPDESAQIVYLKHVLEHFTLADIERILAEVHRISKPSGVIDIRLPHAFCVAAWTDPTHKTAFTFGSGWFFDASSPKAYYRELRSIWNVEITCSHVTVLDWKQRHMRRVDALLGRLIQAWINWLLKRRAYFPSSADLLVKWLPMFFVEIRWQFHKPVVKQAEREADAFRFG